MLTYSFDNVDVPLYEYIYKRIREDILNGTIPPGSRLPSKRTFAKNNGISTITIQNAYDQLISEGYIITSPRRGYFVADIKDIPGTPRTGSVNLEIKLPAERIFPREALVRSWILWLAWQPFRRILPFTAVMGKALPLNMNAVIIPI